MKWANYDVENEDSPQKQNPCPSIEFYLVFDNKTPDDFDATVAITGLHLMDQSIVSMRMTLASNLA